MPRCSQWLTSSRRPADRSLAMPGRSSVWLPGGYQTAGAPQSQGDVKIKSPQLYAETNLLEAIVVRNAAVAGSMAGGPMGGGPAGPGGARQSQPGMPQNPTEHFEVRGRSVQIKLVPRGEQLAIAGATIDHDARLEQWNTATSVKKRLLMVKGQHIEVTDADNEATHVTIKGPAWLCGSPGHVTLGRRHRTGEENQSAVD